MPLIYVTGAPGVGKSTITNALSKLDLKVYDIDDPQFGGPYNLKSGLRVTIPPAKDRADDWFSYHEWRLDSDAVARLAQQSNLENTTTYLCGVAEGDEIILPYFDKIIYLALEDSLLLQRLINRTDNDFGKNESERKMILARKKKLDDKYEKMDVYIIDASQSIDSITSIIRDLNS